MRQPDPPLPDVYSARDLARALDVPRERLQALFASGLVRTVDAGGGAFITFDEAMRVMRAVAANAPLEAPGVWSGEAEAEAAGAPGAGAGSTRTGRARRAAGGAAADPERARRAATSVVVRAPRFTLPGSSDRDPLLPLAVSGSIHVGLIGLLIALAFVGVPHIRAAAPVFEELPARLVFLVQPGPGGGGGGGGLKQPKPPSRAQRKGDQSLSSPMPDPPPPPPEPAPKPEPEPPPVLAPVEAPVATVKNDPQNQAGVLETPKPAPPEPSQGPGTGGGAGTGEGTGLGRGNGAGVGDGSEAGMGGGPYRPGSGVEPPSLLREVKPDYTEDARRRGVEGEVVMEIVVRRDGTVGDVRVLKGLGYGLDQRAIEAVRQWRFGAARRLGQVVDVLVEVSMEFRLR